jgi:hypothetical protein
VNLTAGPHTLRINMATGNFNLNYLEFSRVASGNADLSALILSAGPLNPVFNPATTTYTVSVPNGISATNVTPTVAVGAATVKVNGMPVPSGAASAFLPLLVGPNLVTVAVTAENGTQKAYTIQVTRAAAGSPDLANLTLSAGPLSPAFSPGVTGYTLTVPNGISTTTVTATVVAGTSTVKVNGMPVPSGTPSGLIPLAVGPNLITAVVTAGDGMQKAYTVQVIRAPNGNADLAGLILSGGSLNPVFNPATLAYSVNVPNSLAMTTITPTLAALTSTVKVNGVPVASGTASGAIPLLVGANANSVLVTAANGLQKTYTVQVVRAPAP